VILTGVLALFTAVLAISTVLLWRTTKKDTRILQRAYIAVEPLCVHLTANRNSVTGHVAIKNAGHLPARKLSAVVSMSWSKKGDEPEASFPKIRHEGNIVIAPGSIAIRGAGTTTDIQTLNNASGTSSGKLQHLEDEVFLYVWGSVRYDNGFRRMRTTRFCHRYNWKRRQGYEVARQHARYHEHGNDAN
jgi:hypothetical protein